MSRVWKKEGTGGKGREGMVKKKKENGKESDSDREWGD